MRRALLLLAALALQACTTVPPYASVEPGIDAFEPFDVPLRVDAHGVLHVEVETSDGLLDLIVDTGADHAVLLRSDTEARERFAVVDREWHGNASGNWSRTAVRLVPWLRIGALRFTDVRAPEEGSDLPDFMTGDGMIGRGLLGEVALDVDAPHRRLGVAPSGWEPGDDERGAWTRVALLATEDGAVVPVEVDGSGRVLRVVLDTGAIAFADDVDFGLLDPAPDLGATGERDEGLPVHRATSVRLGGVELGAADFFLLEHPDPPRTDGFLGPMLHRRVRYVLDLAAGAVWIRAPG
ncbi:MAG: hypothetical protein R3F34_04970 [Planctomycetota bacterium]